MQNINKINFYINEEALVPTIDKIYNLVRSHNFLLKDTRKVFATKLRNFIYIMKTWGWDVSTDKSGNVVNIQYFGDEPFNHQKILFENIAPYIKPGCFIKFEEDNSKEIWEFDGEKMIMNHVALN